MAALAHTDEMGADNSEGEEAFRISETLVRKAGYALLAGDFAAFRACLTLPKTIDTFDGKSLIEDEDALRRAFNAAVAYLLENQVDQIERWIVEASFTGDKVIRSLHKSQNLSRGALVGEHMVVLLEIRKLDVGWRISDSSYVSRDENYTNAILHAVGGGVARRD